MKVWTISDTGVVRQQNQDSFRVEELAPEQMLLVVCDGMGGARAGNVASELAVSAFGDAVLERLADPERNEDVARMLSDSAEIANRVIWHRASTDPQSDSLDAIYPACPHIRGELRDREGFRGSLPPSRGRETYVRSAPP